MRWVPSRLAVVMLEPGMLVCWIPTSNCMDSICWSWFLHLARAQELRCISSSRFVFWIFFLLPLLISITSYVTDTTTTTTNDDDDDGDESWQGLRRFASRALVSCFFFSLSTRARESRRVSSSRFVFCILFLLISITSSPLPWPQVHDHDLYYHGH